MADGHRYSLDEETKVRRLEGDGVHGAIDNLPEDADVDQFHQDGNTPYLHGRTRESDGDKLGRSGGSDLVDDLFENPESGDTELLSMVDEFLREKYKVGYSSEYGLAVKDKDPETIKEQFREWMNEGQFGESEDNYGVLISKGSIDTKPEVREKLSEMASIWTDPQTSVKYKVSEGKDEDNDVLEFKNGNNKKVEITVGELNAHLATQVTGKNNESVRTRIRRPWKGKNADIYARSLRSLNFGTGTFAGKKVTAEFPRWKPKEEENKWKNPNEVKGDINSFDLNVDLKQFRRDHGVDGQDFFGVWTHHGKDEIKSMSFVVENDAITKIRLNLNPTGGKGDFESVEISTELFLEAFKNSVKPYESVSGGVVGLKFLRKDGREFTVGPKTPSKSAERTVFNMRINGTALPENLPVFVENAAKSTKKESAVEKGTFNLAPRKSAIEGQIDDAEKAWVEKFIDVWKSGKVTDVTIDTKKGAISAIKLTYDDAGVQRSVFLSRTLFHGVFDNVDYYREDPLDSETGFVFRSTSDTAKLTPETSNEEAKGILTHISLDGVKLSDTITVSVNLPKTATSNT